MVANPDPSDLQVLRAFLSRALPELPARYLRGEDDADEDAPSRPEAPTSPEEQLLRALAPTILALTGPREIARLGPCSSRKLRLLVDAGRASGLRGCALLGESAARVGPVAQRLSAEYPRLAVRAVTGDYQRDVARLGLGGERLLVVLIRAFCTLPPREAPRFLARLAAAMERSDHVLLGVALRHEPRDVASYHARVLLAANRRFGADFDAAAFEHVDRFDARLGARELRLRALRPVRVSVPAAGVVLDLAAGQEIRTEVRARYTRARLANLVEGTGLQLYAWLPDPDERVAFALLNRR